MPRPLPAHIERDSLADSLDWPSIQKEMAKQGGGLPGLEARLDLFLAAAFRNKVPSIDACASRLHQTLIHARSPHAWVKTRPNDLEQGCVVRSYSTIGLPGCEIPHPSGASLQRGAAAHLEFVDKWPQDALAAFDSIMQESNGRAAGATFRVIGAKPEPTRELVSALAGTFSPLMNGADAALFNATRVQPAPAFQTIFHVAVCGGAYDQGLGYARGRLYAWQTVAHLVGRTPNTPFNEVLQLARASAWIRVESRSKWFYDQIWDGCVVVIPPDRDIVAIVAWTDTD